MKLLVFGATGGTGQAVLEQAIARGDGVTAFVRRPEALAEVSGAAGDRLRIQPGDVRDAEAVRAITPGHDAVISALGAGLGKSDLREVGTRHIIEAMRAAGLRRLISVSSLGIGASRDNMPGLVRWVIVPLILRHGFADHERQEQVIRDSGLDWTIVRPAGLTNGAHTGVYQQGFPPGHTRIRGQISRADVADFMLKALDDTTTIGQAVGLSY